MVKNVNDFLFPEKMSTFTVMFGCNVYFSFWACNKAHIFNTLLVFSAGLNNIKFIFEKQKLARKETAKWVKNDRC